MPRQEPLNLYGKGVVKTRSGHLRYTSPRHLRGDYVHRKVIADHIAATPYSIRLLLPWPYEVHHQDYNKEHNCGANLLMLSESLHASLTADRKREEDGRFARKFHPKWRAPGQDVADLLEGVPEWAVGSGSTVNDVQDDGYQEPGGDD